MVGARRATAAHDCVELRHWMSPEEPDVELKSILDDPLADELSRHRAVFTMHLDETQVVTVECLTPIRQIWPAYSGTAMMIVQRFDAE